MLDLDTFQERDFAFFALPVFTLYIKALELSIAIIGAKYALDEHRVHFLETALSMLDRKI